MELESLKSEKFAAFKADEIINPLNIRGGKEEFTTVISADAAHSNLVGHGDTRFSGPDAFNTYGYTQNSNCFHGADGSDTWVRPNNVVGPHNHIVYSINGSGTQFGAFGGDNLNNLNSITDGANPRGINTSPIITALRNNEF